MSSCRATFSGTLAAMGLVLAAPALAQPSMKSFTIDCGGGVSTGGPLRLTSSIGQPDASNASGGPLTLRGGFLTPRTCPADFNGNGTLEVADIFAFLNAWFAGSPAADFDGLSGLQVADIFAFLNAWFAGC
ncbi:MAG TPA: GC-type dockerin domain-anchored protein [Phycisphaerales bacterium]|nr:GC-type dockerin domain-anchored protein [Phycisphaerales bacterium]